MRLSGWANVIAKVLIIGRQEGQHQRRRDDALMLVWKVAEHVQAKDAGSFWKLKKAKECDSPLGPPKEPALPTP